VCRRFDPAYSLLKERVRQGEVGHVQTIKVCSRDSPLPTIAYLSTSGTVPDRLVLIFWVVTPCGLELGYPFAQIVFSHYDGDSQ
jgi:hypothetical protein